MRPVQQAFLFCCPLRTGGVIIAIAHMLTAGTLLFINGEYLDDFDAQFLQAREAGCVEGSAAEYNLEKMLLLTDLLTQALGLAFAIFLLLGALKGKAKLVLAWSVYVVLALVLYASRTIGLYLSNGLSSLAHTRSTLALVAVVTLYCAAAMLKLHQELREVELGRSASASVAQPLQQQASTAPPAPPPTKAKATTPYAKAMESRFERI